MSSIAPPLSREDSQQRAFALMREKDTIQAEINRHTAILAQNDSTLRSPLLDPQGFPRADIDIVSVRTVSITLDVC